MWSSIESTQTGLLTEFYINMHKSFMKDWFSLSCTPTHTQRDILTWKTHVNSWHKIIMHKSYFINHTVRNGVSRNPAPLLLEGEVSQMFKTMSSNRQITPPPQHSTKWIGSCSGQKHNTDPFSCSFCWSLPLISKASSASFRPYFNRHQSRTKDAIANPTLDCACTFLFPWTSIFAQHKLRNSELAWFLLNNTRAADRWL